MTLTVHPIRKAVLVATYATALAAPALALAQSTPPPAQEEVRDYIALQVGRDNVNAWSHKVRLGPIVAVDGRAATDAGSVVGLLVGRQEEKTEDNERKIVRYELEYQRAGFKVRSVQVGLLTEAVGGTGKVQALTFNALRHKRLSDNGFGYAGLGLGWGKAELPALKLSNGCNCLAAASKSGLTFLARAGLEYRFDAQHNAFLQYTVLNVQGPSSGTTPGVDYARKWVGAAAVGYRYKF